MDEEWEDRFPILETDMTKEHLKISLSDDKSCLKVILPREQMDAICAAWLQFKTGTAPEERILGRHYTGLWKYRTLERK